MAGISDPIEKTVKEVTEVIRAAENLVKCDELCGGEEMIIEEVIEQAKESLKTIEQSRATTPFTTQLHVLIPAARARAFADVLMMFIMSHK